MSETLTCGECLHIGYCLIRAIARDVEVLRNNECPARTRERELLMVLEAIRDYGNAEHERGSEDGYPSEIIYDEFAYKRIVDAYREAADKAIQKAKGKG